MVCSFCILQSLLNDRFCLFTEWRFNALAFTNKFVVEKDRIVHLLKLQIMKKFIVGVIIFAVTSLFTFNSCNRSKKTPISPKTPLAVINEDSSLSIFSTIVNYSGDENYLNNSKTLVVPDDDAFIRAGITKKLANKFSPPKCDSIVMYYAILNGVNFDASTEKEIVFPSGLGPLLFADSTKSKLYFNGISTVSVKPVRVGNSSIYKLTRVIELPAADVMQITSADKNLSFFNEALKRTGYLFNLADGSFTLLMPVNDAFKKAGFRDLDSIDKADINTLNQILKNQTVSNIYFINDLAREKTIHTLQGKALLVNVSGCLSLKNEYNEVAANILSNGKLADNVLTYKTGDLILP